MHNFVIVSPSSASAKRIATSLPVFIYGELFDRSNAEGMERHASLDALIRFGQDPVEFLQSLRVPHGFILPWHQARDVSWCCVWGHVRKRYRIVLDATNPFLSISQSYIDSGYLKSYIDQSTVSQNRALEFFLGATTFTLKDIVEDWYDLLLFLGLPDTEIPPVEKPPQKENYEELVQTLSSTQYIRYIV